MAGNNDRTSNYLSTFSCIVAYLLVLAVNIGMVVIGVQYSHSCTIEIVPKFLQIGGGAMLGFAIFYVICGISYLLLQETDDSKFFAWVVR